MKKVRVLVVAFIMVIVLASPIAVPITGNMMVVEAATTVKISQKKLSLEVGKTKVLKIVGTKKKVSWKSSKKSVATVSSKGKIKAEGAGTATITATVSNKKYTCKVTVKSKANPYVVNAPFEAVEEKIDIFSFAVPKGWDYKSEEVTSGQYQATITPTDLYSSIILSVETTGEDALSYEESKTYYSENITQEYVQQLFEADLQSSDVRISDFSTNDYDTTLGTAFVAKYSVTIDETTLGQTVYSLDIDNYYIEVIVTDIEDLNLAAVAEYLLDSIMVVK